MDYLSTIDTLDVFLYTLLDVLLLLSPVCKLIHLLSSRLFRLIETSRVVSSISKGVAESNKVVLERYVKSVNITLVVELLVSLTRNLLTILKVEHSKSILPFKISFIVVVHVVLLFSNRDTNINVREFVLVVNRVVVKTGRD